MRGLTPVSTALDRLQSQTDFFEDLVSTFLVLGQKLDPVTNLQVVGPLATHVVAKYGEYFQSFLNIDLGEKMVRWAVFAVVTHPFHRLRFLKCTNVDRVEAFFIRECYQVSHASESEAA